MGSTIGDSGIVCAPAPAGDGICYRVPLARVARERKTARSIGKRAAQTSTTAGNSVPAMKKLCPLLPTSYCFRSFASSSEPVGGWQYVLLGVPRPAPP